MQALAQAILDRVAGPMHYGGMVLNCTVSIGSSSFPADDGSGTELLKNADMALYAAKAAGRNRYAAYHAALRVAVERRVTVLRSARSALERDAIVPFYQPKVSLFTNATVGFEALLRWRDAAGLQGPAAIQEAFTDPELAIQIGERMLAKVIADIRAWRMAGLPFGSVALNVSGAEFANIDVAERALTALREAGLPTDVLEIEVVESVLFDDRSDRSLDMLRRLEREGVALALDDFGTGFASLTHLQKFPVKWLKIDRSFMHDLPDGGASAAIVRSVVGLAHDLGMQVVAEGVETRLQQRALSRMNCDVVQGYLVAKPMAAPRVAHFLATWTGFSATCEPPAARVAVAG